MKNYETILPFSCCPLLGGHFGPEKKYLAPPPPHRHSPGTLPPPAPPPRKPPPPPSASYLNWPPPGRLLGRLPLSPAPEQEKK